MSVPAIRYLRDHSGHEVDVLVGTTRDDVGAHQVLRGLSGVRLMTDHELLAGLGRHDRWDIGIGSIPYDGRWDSLLENHCDLVLDCRPRPDPSTFGFSSWRKHEAEYQHEIARDVCHTCECGGYFSRSHNRTRGCDIHGWHGRLDTSFWAGPVSCGDYVYLGVGRKRDVAGFWDRKHWGDENFVVLAERILTETGLNVVCTGDTYDVSSTGRVMLHALSRFGARFSFMGTGLERAFDVVAGCHSYIGNDTGMMHVAASMDKSVVAVFNLEGTLRKNHPLCSRWRVLEGHTVPVSVETVYDAWRSLCTPPSECSSPARPVSSADS